VELLLDGVSAFGAETIAWEDWNVTAYAATANKCLHGAPGISFVIAKISVFHDRPSAANSIYLDLYTYYKAQLAASTPFTQAVHICYALQQALKELEEAGGQQARQAEYRYRAARIRKGMKALGIRTLLPEDAWSASLTSFLLPEGIRYRQLHDQLKQDGFIIYAGQGSFKNEIFRIANMGAINSEAIDRLLQSFSNFFSIA
ncbi:MAG: aminotransferase class V-fold PLP-dependent enzyme, partial [Sinomicrobium sp.]|nr:aminotransferase class V-fold PLP-dependent enzyme [Sinomicrobium sp.]